MVWIGGARCFSVVSTMSLSLASSSSRLMELYEMTSSRCWRNRSWYLLRNVVVSVECVTGTSGND